MAESKTDGGLRAGLRQVQSTLRRVQSESERVASRLRKEAGDLIGRDRQRAVQDLLTQARKLRTDFQKRAERAMKDIEERGQKLVSTLERQAERGVEPFVRRLNLPTRDELEKLKKRVSHLEKRIEEIAAANTKAA